MALRSATIGPRIGGAAAGGLADAHPRPAPRMRPGDTERFAIPLAEPICLRQTVVLTGTRMKRRTGLFLALAFLAGAALTGPAWRLVAPRLGLPMAFAETGGDARAFALFSEVLQRVQADYVEPVSTATLVHKALSGMLSGLDPHSSYMDARQWREMQVETRGRFGGLGMTVTSAGGALKVISPIDGTPAARAGVKAGDLIDAVDGKTIEGLSLSDAVEKLRGPPDTQVRITIRREGNPSPIQLTLTREIIHVEVVKSRRYGDIGYIRLSEFNDEADRALRAALISLQKPPNQKLAGLILDLRNNPGGLLDQAVAVADDFLSGGEIVSTHGRQTDDDRSWYAREGDLTHGIPMVVLINNGSASAAEIVAGALQENHRALLLGTRSFGKGSVQTLFPLRGEGAIRLTTARYYTPGGRSIQGDGIEPDVVVRESDEPEPTFGPAHESDLNNVLRNPNGPAIERTRRPPPIAESLAGKPPKGWPTYDANKPDTDFQLHQAVTLMRLLTGAGSPPPRPSRPISGVPRHPT